MKPYHLASLDLIRIEQRRRSCMLTNGFNHRLDIGILERKMLRGVAIVHHLQISNKESLSLPRVSDLLTLKSGFRVVISSNAGKQTLIGNMLNIHDVRARYSGRA